MRKKKKKGVENEDDDDNFDLEMSLINNQGTRSRPGKSDTTSSTSSRVENKNEEVKGD